MGASLTPVAFVNEGLGNSSYLVDVGDGLGLVIDPERHPAAYLAEADRRRITVAYAAETHLHADFVSGARELHAQGARLIAPAGGAHEFPVARLHHEDELPLSGGLTLRALATPGHTPEHLAYLLLDGGRPVALFSGGSLLVGSIARTDLISADQTEPLARELWRSVREHILPLPDDLPVYPTHGAGSFCAAPAGTERTTTIGREKARNPLLAAPDEDTFVRNLLAGFGSFPPYFLRLREVNRHGPLLHGRAEPHLQALTVDEVLRYQAGAYIVDARPVAAYGQAHIPGSVSIPLRPQFASWLGWIVPADTAIVFVLDPDQDRADLVRQARNIGYEHTLGELTGGIDAWLAAGHPVDSIPVVDAAQASAPVIDVRQRNEFSAGHLPGAHNVELGSLAAGELPAGPVAVMCGHGERAMTAASLLRRSGRNDVTVLTGGPDDWAATHGELETGA